MKGRLHPAPGYLVVRRAAQQPERSDESTRVRPASLVDEPTPNVVIALEVVEVGAPPAAAVHGDFGDFGFEKKDIVLVHRYNSGPWVEFNTGNGGAPLALIRMTDVIARWDPAG